MSPSNENQEKKSYSDKLQNSHNIDKISTTSLNQYIDSRESTDYNFYPGAEAEEYDFAAERHNLYPTNLIESTAHLVKACLGAGILSMHEGFKFAGLWTGLVFTMVLGLVMSHIMLMLVRSAQKLYVVLRIPKLSYPDLVEAAIATGPWKALRSYSKWFRYAVDLCLFTEMCGTCCIYQIMIANTLMQVLEIVSPEAHTYHLSLRIYILIITIPLILLCLIKKLKYLAPFSLIADIFLAVCVAAAMYYSLISERDIQNRPGWKNTIGFIRFCSICMYSLDGVAAIMPVENNMRSPKDCPTVVLYGMTIVVTSAVIIGFFGYWAWGEHCQSPFTLHMPSKETFPIVMQFLLTVVLSITFAVQFWVAFRVIWCYISKKIMSKFGLWERIYRCIHVLSITCLSIAFPHLIKLMVFLGSFCLAFIALIFPPLIDIFLTWQGTGTHIRFILLKNILLITFGIITSTSVFYIFFID